MKAEAPRARPSSGRGADLATVKQNFRRLMRKHHPDVHAGGPERQRVATERSKQITQAYTELERHLQSR
jgi:curved DNA-binding protein CbpA